MKGDKPIKVSLPLFTHMQLLDDKTIVNTLKKHNAYVTQNRINVLKVLSQNKGSTSIFRIMKSSPVLLDRVSVYRTLQFFLRKGLILTVPSSKGNTHYILKNLASPGQTPYDKTQMVHFLCNKCGHTEVVDQTDHLQFRLPENYLVIKSNIVLEGLCSRCNR